MTAPFELTLRLRNNILKQFRTELGLTPQQFADKIGISYQLYLRCEGLKWSPVGSDAGKHRWKPAARTIAEFVGLPPEEIWPQAVLEVTDPILVREMSASDLGPMLQSQQAGVSIAMLPEAPDEMLERHQKLSQIMGHLDNDFEPRAASIFRDRVLYDRPFRDIAKQWGISRSRVQQLFAQTEQALREKCQRGS